MSLGLSTSCEARDEIKQRGTNIPSVAFSKIQDLSFLHLVIICPAYATERRVSQTVKQD
jgi:hypothetical protein